jgi:hypothetical protein
MVVGEHREGQREAKIGIGACVAGNGHHCP